MCSASVWPSEGWLPSRRVECSTQVSGWFGLASEQFPGRWVAKHELARVEELALEAEPATAGAPAVLGVSTDWVVDCGEMRTDLVGAPRLEPD